MDLSFSAEDETFRDEVRAFLAEARPQLPEKLCPPELATRTGDGTALE